MTLPDPDDFDGLRECDTCGMLTDAGAWPDWVNGSCEQCDPAILDDPDNAERVSPEQLANARFEVDQLHSRRN